MTSTIRILCDVARCEECAHECKGKGHMDVATVRPVAHPTSPCCAAAYRVVVGVWSCAKCGASIERKQVMEAKP